MAFFQSNNQSLQRKLFITSITSLREANAHLHTVKGKESQTIPPSTTHQGFFHNLLHCN